ncbi:MAG: EAL domain-containing protein [Porticoccus sp.]|nr:EAL domain-containing protein [Porticoccus sp.]
MTKTPNANAVRLRVLPLIAFMTTLLVGLFIIHNQHRLWQKEQSILMSEVVSSQGGTIQRHLSRSLSSTYILKSLIEVDQSNIKNFETYAKNISDSLGGITNLQLAPGGIIQKIYPLEGHEKAIGLNILKLDNSRDDAAWAISHEELVLSGPFELVQGGNAVVGRNPIFLNNAGGKKSFWGFVSVLIYLDDLLSDTDLDTLKTKGYYYQLSKVRSDTEYIFAKSHTDMNSAKTIIKKTIEIPNGTWILSMGREPRPWHYITLTLQIFLAVCLSALMTYITYALLRRPIQLQQLVDEKTEALHKLAFYDPLTKLCNRRLFNDLLTRMIATTERNGTQMALLYLDLDDFKRVNDSLGHESGDQLLKVIGKRITAAVRKSDITARIGGDEFCILLPNIQSPLKAADIAEKVLHAIGLPIKLGTHSVRVTPSIGITLAPLDGVNAAQLLKNADLAMYSAKENSRNNYQFFENKLNTDALARLILERELSQAVENNELILHYQPQVCLLTRKIKGIEALVRWQHPSKGFLPPGEFIQFAEDSRLIIPIGTWVLEQACLQLKKLNLPELTVSVNLSPRQFAAPNLLDTIKKALSNSGLKGHQLELEITETALMKNMANAITTLKQIKSLGIQIAIDDFGTGYSSLSQLKNLPADTLKIDREFIKDINKSTDNSVITEVIVSMGHKLGLTVIAEGVETEEQVEFIRQIQCDMAQGYFFSRPVDEVGLIKFLSMNT